MLVYNCIVVDVGSCISQVTLSGFHCYVLLDSDSFSDSDSHSQVITIVHELKRRAVLVAYWLLNLIGAN